MDESMDRTAVDTLYDHQARALGLVDRAGALLDDDACGALAALPQVHAEMASALRDYQIFKHDRIFDPAVGSGDAECARLGRAMKIECIASGEAFRVHGQRWKPDAMAADWSTYRVSARLTLNALRRHLERERDGIQALIAMLATGACAGR